MDCGAPISVLPSFASATSFPHPSESNGPKGASHLTFVARVEKHFVARLFLSQMVPCSEVLLQGSQ